MLLAACAVLACPAAARDGEEASVLLVTNEVWDPGDVAIQDSLEALGLDVVTVPHDVVATSDADGMAFVYVSSTCSSGNITNKFKDVSIPVIMIEPYALDDMGMTVDADSGRFFQAVQRDMWIESEGHFLAAGLTGEVQVFDDLEIQSGQGRPGPEGYRIASYLQEDEDPPWPVYGAIFAYEQGAMLADSTIAAGRRYFAGFNDMGTFYLTETGWKLWHAAVYWALYRDQTSVEKNPPVPSGFRLYPNTPNPFNPATEIFYTLPEKAPVRLVLADNAGRSIRILAEGEQESGTHSLRLDASGLASGIYFCMLESGAFRSSIKMMLLR
jgi:hypothetical protein